MAHFFAGDVKELHAMQVEPFKELLEKYQDFGTGLANENVEKEKGIKKRLAKEEDWGKSYDDYRELERELDSIYFAYNGK